MKLLFLDVDGVLNHYGSRSWIDPACLARLRRILDATGARSVLSSDWKDVLLHPERHDPTDLARVRTLYEDPGLHFAGITPNVDPDRRELEIAAFLANPPEPVDAFAILDDLEFGFRSAYPDNFVRTAGMPGGGLTDANADVAIKILLKET